MIHAWTQGEVDQLGSFLRMLDMRDSGSELAGSDFPFWKWALWLEQPSWVMLKIRQQRKLGEWKRRERTERRELGCCACVEEEERDR